MRLYTCSLPRLSLDYYSGTLKQTSLKIMPFSQWLTVTGRQEKPLIPIIQLSVVFMAKAIQNLSTILHQVQKKQFHKINVYMPRRIMSFPIMSHSQVKDFIKPKLLDLLSTRRLFPYYRKDLIPFGINVFLQTRGKCFWNHIMMYVNTLTIYSLYTSDQCMPA